MMRKAREKNKNLLLIAEIQTGNSHTDTIFFKKVGINAILRELAYCKTSQALFENLQELSRT